jgi:hypothetical protein
MCRFIVSRSSDIDSCCRDFGSSRCRVAHRPAVWSIAALIGVAGVNLSAVQVRNAWRGPSSVLGCEWAASTVLVESVTDSVRLFSELGADKCEYNKAGRTKPCSRIAMTSSGVDNLLAAIC